MTILKRIVSCAMTAAWFGCLDQVNEVTAEEEQEALTPGAQLPIEAPNASGLGYYQYLPVDYDTGASFPLVVFFHGAGERGNGALPELERVLRHGPPKLIRNGRHFPAIVISPQVAAGASWSPSVTTPFVNYIMNAYKVDRSRVYITGLSLGGDGTWAYAVQNAGIPAAIVPICGPDRAVDYSVLRGMPIWTFHKIGDSTVPISETQNILQEVTGVRPEVVDEQGRSRAGQTGYFVPSTWNWRTGYSAPGAAERPAFTVYPTDFGTPNGHDAWTPAYDHQPMWDWMFAQRRTSPPPIIVFQQDFQSSTLPSDYESSTNPNIGQFNDIGGEASGGTFGISSGRLRLVRTGAPPWTGTLPSRAGPISPDRPRCCTPPSTWACPAGPPRPSSRMP